jgi:hypothetical protein
VILAGCASTNPDSLIRDGLLVSTPKGTSGPDALAAFLRARKHKDRVDAYSGYVEAVEISTTQRLPVISSTQRTIRAVLSERPIGFALSKLTIATWHFDERDRLIDITVETLTIGL